ncbi:hypothetical protein DV736_g677, partial [Chaetothyriales sp. CBS 134916]
MANAPLPTGNISITIGKQDDYINYGTSTSKTAKKGPSRREKQIRVRTHQLHVQFLLYHNLLRNSWTCDKEVQAILVRQLPSDIEKQVDKWRRTNDLVDPIPPKSSNKEPRNQARNARNQRDWGRPSSRLEPHAADMSRGDPLISLLRTLSAYWKNKFAVTAPGLRKRGYGTRLELRRHVDSFQRGQHHPELHGERIHNLSEFRELARTCQGSRDVGAQLFTALLRGLGIEARMVASLQPAGYGWTKVEQTAPSKEFAITPAATKMSEDRPSGHALTTKPVKRTSALSAKQKQPARQHRSQKGTPVHLNADAEDESDSDSVIDITPAFPSVRRPLYDRELAFPIYWTEAISPITSKPIPCSPLVLQNPVATTDEHLVAFEPRGAKAEAFKLVIAYVVGYSSDNTAKDLTVRYLRKHIFPGKTKPFRFPVQSIPVYSSSGSIKRHEDYDWFKTVLSPYTRSEQMRTATDDLEDSTDLVGQEPQKKPGDGLDTLGSLKSNPDFVLERHLRREEAIRPGAKPDRFFVSGKEPNLKSEPVYRRSHVERCLTAESWHKEGRRPKHAEVPMKLVPVRAVTLTRKREAEEHERITGEKQLQGLYSWDQTEYIVPPPIENGVIPKNTYGNIDAFVPSMVPRGAKHIPLRGTVRICKKLDIDFAEAVVGFEFGNKRAVPVIQGVVVAEENETRVRNAWKEYEDAQRKKEETKMERLVLDLWRKFVMGLRIRKEVGQVYGDRAEASNDPRPLTKKGDTKDEPIDLEADDQPTSTFETTSKDIEGDKVMGGGFLLPDEEDCLPPEDLVMEEAQGTREALPLHQNPSNLEGIFSLGAEQVSSITTVNSTRGKAREAQYPESRSIHSPMSRRDPQPKMSLLRQTDSSSSNATTNQSDSELSSSHTGSEPINGPTVQHPAASAAGACAATTIENSSLSDEYTSPAHSWSDAAAKSDSSSQPESLPDSSARRRRIRQRPQYPTPPTGPEQLRSERSTCSAAATAAIATTSHLTQASGSAAEKKKKEHATVRSAAKTSAVQERSTATTTPTSSTTTPTRRRGEGQRTESACTRTILTSPYFDSASD